MALRPGVPPTNEPSTFIYQTDERLVTNSNITRMPTNQRQWNSFVQELNKWIKVENGTFNPTFTGFSSDPGTVGGEGPSCWWNRFGQIVHIEFVFSTGTSDATDFTITNLPSSITPKVSQTFTISGATDASVAITTPGAVKIGSDSVITFYSSGHLDTWTNTGSKGFVAGGRNILYSLRNPGQH